MRGARGRRLGALIGGLLLALVPAAPLADYVDPWGLPSGSATLPLLTQDQIAAGSVQGFDFATGQLLLYDSYTEMVAAGQVDLLFFEMVPDELAHFLRAPEDGDFFDRALIYSLEDSLTLEEITGILDAEGQEVVWERFGSVAADFTYLLLQVQEGEIPETTAIKFAVRTVDATSVAIDWAWQANGGDFFIPSPTRGSTFGAIKALYR